MEQAEIDNRIMIITPDLGFSVLEPFGKKFPNRLINAGIAEQNAIGIASGLALSGMVVYVYSIIPFVTMRCYEQIRVDVAYLNANVRLVGVGAGLSYGPAGATHHALEDISLMRSLPNMTVCCPGDPIEVRDLVRSSFTHEGPMYIRLGKNGETCIHDENQHIELGQAVTVRDYGDSEAVLITTSNTFHLALEWVDQWKNEEGINVMLVSMPTIKPFDNKKIIELIDLSIPIFTLEEHTVIGGLGTTVAEVIAEYGKPVQFKRIGIPDVFTHVVGDQHYLRKELGIVKPKLN
ncbi:transketolase C-terminal domain-containing protein [Paenibacillus anseongense]